MPKPPSVLRTAPMTAGGLLALAAFALTSAVPATPDPVAALPLNVVGSRALAAPIADWLALYRLQHPGARATSAMYGTGLAASAMAERRADVAPMARAMIAGERALLSAVGEPAAVIVGRRADAGGRGLPFFLYLARDSDGRTDAAAVAFARVALGPAGQARLGGAFAPLAADDLARAAATLAALERHMIADGGLR